MKCYILPIIKSGGHHNFFVKTSQYTHCTIISLVSKKEFPVFFPSGAKLLNFQKLRDVFYFLNIFLYTQFFLSSHCTKRKKKEGGDRKAILAVISRCISSRFPE